MLGCALGEVGCGGRVWQIVWALACAANLSACMRAGFETGGVLGASSVVDQQSVADGPRRDAPLDMTGDQGIDAARGDFAADLSDGAGADQLADLEPMDSGIDRASDAASADATTAIPWVRSVSGDSNLWVCGVAVAPNGDVLLGAHAAASTINLGGPVFTAAGVYDVYLARYDSRGAHLWSRQLAGPQAEMCDALAVDREGNAVLVGNFWGTADFGAGPVASRGGIDIFVTSFAPDGQTRWSKHFGGSSNDSASRLAIDAQGNVILSGYTMAEIDFGGGNLPSRGIYDTYLAKFASNGDYLWAKRLGGASSEFGGGVAVDLSGDLFLAGTFYADVDFGAGTLPNAGGSDLFVARFDAQGGLVWSRRFGGAGNEGASGIMVHDDGRLAVGGTFDGAMDLGGGTLTSAGGTDVFLMGLSGDGGHQWSVRCGGVEPDDGPVALLADSAGNAFAALHFRDSATCTGSSSLGSAGSMDILMVSVSPGGTLRWVESFGGADYDTLGGIALATEGTVLAGILGGAVDFGAGSSGQSGDIFLTLVPWRPSDKDISP